MSWLRKDRRTPWVFCEERYHGIYIPIHRDNVGKSDWIILLEAGIIVGRSGEKLRIAQATQELKDS
jgi:hypothetical protein